MPTPPLYRTPFTLGSLRGFLLDMDGTIYLGDQLFPWTQPFLQTLDRLGLKYLFLTNNSSKDRSQYCQKLNRLGIQAEEEQILTSGEATIQELLRQDLPKEVYVAGTPSLQEEFRRAGFQVTEENPQLVVLGFDTETNYEKLSRLCSLVRKGLPYIATHPDLNCPTDEGFIPDTGSFIALVEASTGRKPDQIIGKPNAAIAEAAAKKLDLALVDLGMVGDRLYTDIALSYYTPVTSILVFSGETQPDDLFYTDFLPDYSFPNIGALGDALSDLAEG